MDAGCCKTRARVYTVEMIDVFVEEYLGERLGFGYWISPSGKIFDVDDDDHIAALKREKVKSHLKPNELKIVKAATSDTFATYDKLVKMGWIRISGYNTGMGVDIPNFNSSTLRRVRASLFDAGFSTGYKSKIHLRIRVPKSPHKTIISTAGEFITEY